MSTITMQQQINSKPRTDKEREELERFAAAYVGFVGSTEIADAIQRRRKPKYKGEEKSWDKTIQHAKDNIESSKRRKARADRL